VLGQASTVTAPATNKNALYFKSDDNLYTKNDGDVEQQIATLAGFEYFQHKSISGLENNLTDIANASLVNSAITINGSSISLGGSATIAASTTNALTVSTGLQLNSGTTFNGSAARTISIDTSVVVTVTGVQLLSDKLLTEPQIDIIYDNFVSPVLEFNPVVAGVNYFRMTGGATGSAATLAVVGSDTNIALNLVSKGTEKPQANGVEIATISDTQTITNKSINASNNTLTNIPNSALVNDDFAINGTLVTLGTSHTITATTSNALTVSTGLQLNSGTTFDGSVARTISIDSSVATLTGSQTLTNKILTTPVIDAIVDTNANTIVGFTSVYPGTTPANFPIIYNSATGNHVKFRAVGSDTHVGIEFDTQSLGDLTFNGRGMELVIASVSGVDFNVTTKTTLFTVPNLGGRKLIVTRAYIRNASAAFGAAAFSIGYNADADDVSPTATYPTLDSSTKFDFIPAGAGAVQGNSGDVLGLKCTVAQGSALTATVDVFGYYV